MTITLFVIGFVVFVGAILNSSLTELQNKVDINVYLTTDAPEADILALKSALEELPQVAVVTYVTREEALANFRARHENDQILLQALDELDENPLGAVLNIRAQETSQYESIAAFLEGDDALAEGVPIDSIIDRVNFLQNKLAIERLTLIIDAARTLGLVVTIVLVAMSIVITFNTIRLVIFIARKEISVMRLVGASAWYIRGPFVVSGAAYGIIAGIVTLIIFYPLALWLGPITERFFGSINVFEYYISNFGQLFLLLVCSGIVLGAFSSFLAVRRHLKL